MLQSEASCSVNATARCEIVVATMAARRSRTLRAVTWQHLSQAAALLLTTKRILVVRMTIISFSFEHRLLAHT